jgi:hypothetical protein
MANVTEALEIQGCRVELHDNGDGTQSPVVASTSSPGDPSVELQGSRIALTPTGNTVTIGEDSKPTYAIVVSGSASPALRFQLTGNETVELPDIATASGLYFYKKSTGIGTTTINPSANDVEAGTLIDTAPSYTLSDNMSFVGLFPNSDDSNWYVISKG